MLRWSYPNKKGCGLYFLISGTTDNVFVQQIVEGRAREHQFDGNAARQWRLQVSANNKLGAGLLSESVTLLDIPSSSQRSGLLLLFLKMLIFLALLN